MVGIEPAERGLVRFAGCGAAPVATATACGKCGLLAGCWWCDNSDPPWICCWWLYVDWPA